MYFRRGFYINFCFFTNFRSIFFKFGINMKILEESIMEFFQIFQTLNMTLKNFFFGGGGRHIGLSIFFASIKIFSEAISSILHHPCFKKIFYRGGLPSKAFENRNYSVCKAMGDKHGKFAPVKFSHDTLVIDEYYRETYLTKILNL